MSSVVLGGLFLAFLLVLLAIRIPIAIAMLLTGIGGYVSISGWDPLLNYLKTVAYARYTVYDLSVIPLFLLMGQFASRGGLATGLFRAAAAMVGHWRGGLAISAIGSCAAFGAVCGSSVATAATMGQVALPELRRYKYSNSLAVGCLAAGGTLGILIPPSVVLVIYAILTEQNIAKLFLAAFVPGVLAAIGYMIAVSVYVRVNPKSAGVREPQPMSDRIRAMIDEAVSKGAVLVTGGELSGGGLQPAVDDARRALPALAGLEGGDHLVAGSDPGGLEGELERTATGTDCHRVPRLTEGCEFLF